MRRNLAIFALLLAFAPAGAAAQDALDGNRMLPEKIAVLRAIDKVSARRHTFEIPIDKAVKFGNSLYIKVRACYKSPPMSRPESAAFLQIWERKSGTDEAAWVFSGWMFASSPSLSAMEHPVYDVWVIECKNDSTKAKSETFSSEEAPEGAPEEVPAE